MQILSTYMYAKGAMREFDYLNNSLVFYNTDYPLQLDTMPAIYRKPIYRAKKPRSTNANPVCIPAPYKHNGRV